MGTIRRLSDIQLGSIGSTKVYTVTTNQVLYQISSGMRAFEAGNLGVCNILYGQSPIFATATLYIASDGGAKFWDTITDDFQMAFAIGSAGCTCTLVIHEYKGN